MIFAIVTLVFFACIRNGSYNKCQKSYSQKQFLEGKKIKYDNEVIYLPSVTAFLENDLIFFIERDTMNIDVINNIYFVSNSYKISDSVLINQIVFKDGYAASFIYSIGTNNFNHIVDLSLYEDMQTEVYYKDFIEILRPYCSNEEIEGISVLFEKCLRLNFKRFPVFPR